jgi:serine protease Do
VGFYNDYNEYRRFRKPGEIGRWIAVVVVSALVGSAATLAMIPVLSNRGVLPTTAPTAAVSDVEGKVQPVTTAVNVTVSGGITEAVKRVAPAVMGVVNYAQVSDYFSQNTKLEATGVGTGVLFYKDDNYGYAVTNNHVVEGAAKVEVVLGSGKHVTASVVGTDAYTDLAVLKIPINAVKNIEPAVFANSDNIEVGEPAIAIGTPMGLDFADSVTAGIVSAKKRIMPVEEPQTHQTLDYQAVIQTDAAINPGNSGGPLVNIHGEVIGINSSKIAAPNFEGMGFAIPANEVRTIADQIMRTGHALHPALGIRGSSLQALREIYWPDVPVDYGVWVQAVVSKEARDGGLKPEDVIVAIDGHTVKTMADLRTWLFQMKPGQNVKLRVYRGQQLLNLDVKLGQMQSMNTTNMQPNQDNSDGSDPFSIPNLW